jgi:hypothetical protein
MQTESFPAPQAIESDWAWQELNTHHAVLRRGNLCLVVCIGDEGIFAFWRWRGAELGAVHIGDA